MPPDSQRSLVGRRTRWLHKPTGTLATFVGEDRDSNGAPWAVMETDDGARARIDPLALFRVGGDWERHNDAPAQVQKDGGS